MPDKLRLLFLCTGNSCRSQMAEGLCRELLGDCIDVQSAGLERHGLNPLAVEVMQEIGIDISGHASKTIDDIERPIDVVVTVCGHAAETCPVFPGAATRIHQGFDDPPKLAADAANHEQALVHYRRVRDEIADYVRSLPAVLNLESG